MENKYYTPSIEEFHVDFEYEQLNPQKEWVKKEACVYDLMGIKTTINKSTLYSIATKSKGDLKLYGKMCLNRDIYQVKYREVINNPNTYNEGIRVKYLDQEDIESLGFKYIVNSYDGYFSNGKVSITWFWNKEGVEIAKVTNTDFGKKPLFSGKVKNKSELIRILGQINIT